MRALHLPDVWASTISEGSRSWDLLAVGSNAVALSSDDAY